MKLLNSLLFAAFCLLSAVNAAEPVVPAISEHTAETANASVEKSRNDNTKAETHVERMNNLKLLKVASTLCAAIWGTQIFTCYSECGQSEFLNQGAGIIATGTFDLALKYFKLNWLTPELTISNIPPYVALVIVTALSIVVNAYDLRCVVMPIATFTTGLWFSLLLDFLKQTNERSITTQQLQQR
jgi:hypothetical protein